jgi:NAD(P)-dependent dehydrogenase (short-subunit alcohol dehydrogenase family)
MEGGAENGKLWQKAVSGRKIALVTGGSSGIGLAAARALAARGCRVYEVSRRDVENPGIVHITGDVTDSVSMEAAVGEVVSREGRLDILVCNAGMGISGAVEFTELSEAKALFDVNFFGAVNAARAAMPRLRESRGVLAVTSSAAAVLPIPFQAYYSASKAALNAYALALQNELRPFGVRVRAVMPGDAATGFTAARRRDHRGDEVYGGRISRSVAVMERDERGGMPPETVGRAVARAALRRRGRPLVAVGVQYKIFTVLVKVLPAQLVNWIVGLLYGGGKS